jgi:hypothetical protein
MAEERRRVKPRRRVVHEAEWPGDEGWPLGEKRFGLLLLVCAEVQEAHFDAVKHFQDRAQPAEGVGFDAFDRERLLQEAYRMLLRPDAEDPKLRAFKDAGQARRELDLTEVAWIQNLHTELTNEVSVQRGLCQLEPDEGEADGQ